MGLFSRWFGGGRRRRGSLFGSGVGADGVHQVLDREGTGADLDHLRAFVASRNGVEFYVEPETTATDTTIVAVARDGEWTRRRCGTPRTAARLAKRLGVPVYDVTVTGYPAAMRRWNQRAKADRRIVEGMRADLEP